MFCANCEERLKTDDMFCSGCGTAAENAKKVDEKPAGEDGIKETDEQSSVEDETDKSESESGSDKPDDEAEPEGETVVETPEAKPNDENETENEVKADTAEIEPDSDIPGSEPDSDTTSEKEKPNKKKLTVIIAAAAVAVIIIAVAVVLLVMHLNRTSAYEEAVELMDSGNYSAAHEIFEDLGNFRDSEELALESQLRMDYYAAVQLMDRGNYQGAMEAFQLLGDFRDSAELVTECQQRIDYYYAIQLMEDENFAEARSAFDALGEFRDSATLSGRAQREINYIVALEHMDAGEYQIAMEMFILIGDFRDSADLAVECENRITYGEAVALMSVDNHAEAILLLEPLAEIGFRDSDELLLASNNFITFGLAEEAYDAGLFYTAHTLFLSLGDYRDSRSRAEQSIQEHPETGQIYRNEDFAGRAVEIRIRTPSDDPRPTFLKIYTDEEVLVSTIFLRSGASHTVRLPVGTYMIRMGFGDNWFGTYEYFGDTNAFYITLFLDDEGSTTHQFRSNFIYTLTLRAETELFDLFSGFLNEGRDGF